MLWRFQANRPRGFVINSGTFICALSLASPRESFWIKLLELKNAFPHLLFWIIFMINFLSELLKSPKNPLFANISSLWFAASPNMTRLAISKKTLLKNSESNPQPWAIRKISVIKWVRNLSWLFSPWFFLLNISVRLFPIRLNYNTTVSALIV